VAALLRFSAVLVACALALGAGSARAAPSFQAAGTAAGGTGNATPAWPAGQYQVGDVGLLFCESDGGQAANLTTANGFAAVTNSPQSTGTGTAGTRITVYWARATSTTMAAPTVADPGNHVYCQILVYTDVISSGNPWDITGGGVKATASTSVSVTAVTTSVANTLIVQGVARDTDNNAGAAFGTPANASLTNLTKEVDAGTVSGNGGGFAVWDGGLANAGSSGTTTATVTSSVNAFLTIALKTNTTTLATGTDPAAATVAPGSGVAIVDQFTLQTSGGTEAISSVTVNLSTASGVGRLSIYNNAGTELGFTTSPVTGSNAITVSGMSATTTLGTFTVRITPLSHAAMPAPPGASYSITAPVTSWAGPFTHTGSDTNTNALTIDNQSPNSATAASGSAGDTQVTLNWTTSSSTDFTRSVVLRWTGAAGSEVPVEGTTTYANGNTIGTATVVCVRTGDAASTAVSGVDGGGTGGCSATALTDGTSYSYKVFQQDTSGNYDTGTSIGPFTPLAVTTLATGADPAAATVAPGSGVAIVDQFTLQTSRGTESVTSVTVTLSTASGVGRLSIYNNAGTELGFTTSPATGSNTITVSGMSATTTLGTFTVRVTPLSHAAMPAPPGANYLITAPVTAWAGTNTHAGSDTNANALTIDNLSPNGATAASASAGDTQVTLHWTTSSSSDFTRSVVLRWTGTAGTEVPVEGTTTYANGNTIGTATVVCVRTGDAASTAVSGVDGGGTGGCSATALADGTTYSYKVFQQDTSGNYDTGTSIGSATPLGLLVSINCSGSCGPTSAASVSWTVTFRQSVTGLTAGNFSLVSGGGLGGSPAIIGVSGSGTIWTVTAVTGTGSGTLGLNMTNATGVSPAPGNLPFTGQVFTISGASACSSWYNPAWSYREPITINYPQVGGALSNYPVLVSITDANLQAGAQASGNDIVFTDSSGTVKLAHEIEQYNGATGQLIAWVNVPSVSAAANTLIYMYYGNASVSAQQNPSAVWDANYVGVWHLPNGTTLTTGDSTSNANNGTVNGGVTAATGKIDGAGSFDGSSGYISTISQFNNIQDFAVSAWFRTSSASGRKIIGLETTQTGTGAGMYDRHLYVGTDGKVYFGWWTGSAATVVSTATLNDNAWHYAVGTHTSANVGTLYIDGVAQGTNSGAAQNFNGWWRIGSYKLAGWPNAGDGYFPGQVDEARVSLVARSAAWVLTDYNSQSSPATFLSVGSQQANTCVHHYELSLASTSVTCLPTTVTITACADSSNPCTSVAAINGTASLGTTGGSIVSPVNVVSGVGTSSLSDPGAADNTAVTVSLTGASASAPNAYTCRSGTGCTTTFNTAGFIVSASAGGGAATVTSQVAGVASGTYYLRAVRTNTTTQACEAALQGANTVNFAYECNDPTTCYASNFMSVNGGTPTTIVRNNNGSVSSYTSVGVTFDANGNAPFSLTYGDAGKVTLWAQKTVNSATLTGSSNAFVVRPNDFAFSAIQRTSDSFANPGASGSSGAKFAKAGEAISATVTARASGGATTPSFGLGSNNGSESVGLTQTLIAPSGGATGSLGGTAAIVRSSFSNGVATVTNLTWSEVGVITLTATNSTFLGQSLTTTGTSGNVGRFYPDHFSVSSASITNRSDASCSPASSFSYMGEPFTAAFTLEARNVADTKTQNYATANGFAKLDPTAGGALDFGARDTAGAGTVLTSRLDTSSAPTGSFSGGAAAIAATLGLNRAASPDGAYESLHLGIAPVDSDGVAMNTYDLDADGTAGAERKDLGVTTRVRFGRLRMTGATGSALLPTRVGLQAQYWNGTAFAANTDDACTALAASNFALSGYKINLNACETAALGGASFAGGSGSATLTLAAPGASNNGSVLLTANLGSSPSGNYCPSVGGSEAAATSAVMPYLQGAWSGSGWSADPSVRVGFGVYGSQPNNFIFNRENY